MKKSKKALVALGMSITMTGAVIPTSMPIMAEEAVTITYNDEEYEVQKEGDYKYIVVNDEAVIVGYTNTLSAVVIPSVLGGHTVTTIGTVRGVGAFENNESMQSLIIPDTVKVINAEAFCNCTGLQQVVVGKGLETIGASAFSGCIYLQKIQFNGNSLKEIGECAFWECAMLDSLTIPESVQSIEDFAFGGCKMLTSIVIPDSVTVLGGGAFFNCNQLKSAVVGKGITELKCGEMSWQDNWGKEHGILGTFEGCAALETVTLPDSLLTIGTDAFAGSGLQEITIPKNTTALGDGAFMSCPNLKKAVIGENVLEMGAQIFYECPVLTEVTIGKRVDKIGDRAFWKCTALSEIIIPSSVTKLGGGAFFGCTSLKKAVVGNGVTALNSCSDSWVGDWGSYAHTSGMFEGCISLTDLTLGSSIVSIDVDAFAGTAVTNVTIPDSVVTMDNGVFMNCVSLEAVTIGDGVTKIGDYAFAHATALKSVKIGKGVNSIGNEAFYQCSSLKKIVLPSNVASIGYASFYECTSLEEAIIGNGITSLESKRHSFLNNYGDGSHNIGMFEGCTSLKRVTLGSSVTTIGIDAFGGTALTEILLPSKLNSIGYAAFYNIPTLTNVYFTGTAPTIDENGIFKPIVEDSAVVGISEKCFCLEGQSGYDTFKYETSTFTPNKVTFDLNSTDVLAITPTEQLLSPNGGRVIEPLEPMAADYVFGGWYKEATCETPWNFETDMATESITLYAKWTLASETIPVKPTTVLAGKTTDKSIFLTWDKVSGATGYQIYVDGKLWNSTAVSETSYTIENLDEHTSYEINVTAVNAAGESESSLTIVAKTILASEMPDTENPDTENPDTENPDNENPDNKNPDTENPDNENPDTENPDTEKPDNENPDTGVQNPDDEIKNPSQEVPKEEVNVIKGDVNSDKQITLEDAQLALKAALKINKLTATSQKAADVNADNQVNLTDAQQILKAALKIIKL